jgi:hypothetical protein
MPALNSPPDDNWGIDDLLAMYGLDNLQDEDNKKWVIEGIALDLDITPAEAETLLKSKGYLRR